MKEVFETIIDKLEQVPTEYRHEEYNAAVYDVIKYIKRIAENYNNGWIPCEERLPEEYGEYLCCNKYSEYIIGYPVARKSSDDFYVETEHEIMNDCVAWQPLPAPYKPKKGTHND